MNYKKIWITDKILEIRFENKYDLCHSTYVFSHHYEDPEWNGKIFTRLELDEYYCNKYADANWWKKRWSGSNLPDCAFKSFLEGRFIGLTDFELDLLNDIRNIKDPYYVIMTSEDSLYARDHELAHALWHTNSEYKNEAQNVLSEFRGKFIQAEAEIRKIGYSDKVLEDEIHVYCGIYYELYLSALKIKVPIEMKVKLMNLYEKFKP